MTDIKLSSDITGILSPENFNIAGSDIIAYYDGAHKLVFVLDSVITNTKPNVLLVINSVGDRKWDDILVNDFNMNLENVRPKKDNKYQKLDIEYGGLSVYDNLINLYKAGSDLSDALAQLKRFRNAAGQRSASDRLKSANIIGQKTTETIKKTTETLKDIKAGLKGYRAKLSEQRKLIGKEPTKQSAAKILRTEAQIDNANAKIKRTNKRLSNAEKRLATANEDAKIASNLLDFLKHEAALESYVAQTDQPKNIIPSQPVAPVQTSPVMPVTSQPVPPVQEIKEVDLESGNIQNNTVDPLFEKDPNIMDDKIAFKPIEFGNFSDINNSSDNMVKNESAELKNTSNQSEKINEISTSEPVSELKNTDQGNADVSVEFKPLSFAPIESVAGDAFKKDDKDKDESVSKEITNVSDNSPVEIKSDSNNLNSDGVSKDFINDLNNMDEPIPENITTQPVSESVSDPVSFVPPEFSDKEDLDNVSEKQEPILRPVLDKEIKSEAKLDIKDKNIDSHEFVSDSIEQKPASTDVKLLRSPGTMGMDANASGPALRHKPNVVYYIMLVILMAMSVIALLLYQKHIENNKVPNLIVTNKIPVQSEIKPALTNRPMKRKAVNVSANPSLMQKEPMQIAKPDVMPVIQESEQRLNQQPVILPPENVFINPPVPENVSAPDLNTNDLAPSFESKSDMDSFLNE